MARLPKGIAYPATQLVSAGLAFSVWMVFSRTTPSDEQLVPIAAFTLGTPGALMVTLGISYLVPNYYREAAESARAKGGAWSEPILIAATLCLFVSSLGVGFALLSFQSPSFSVCAAVLGMASIIASGILVSQVGRSSGKFSLAVIGAVATPTVAAIWMISTSLTRSEPAAVLSANALSLALVSVLLATLAPTRADAVAMSRADRYLMLRRSVVLLPHLLLFGLLLQGLRIPAAIGGSDTLVVQAHQAMLVISVGFTFISSVNSYVGAKMQSAVTSEYLNVRRAGVGAYAIASVVAFGLVETLWLTLTWIGAVPPFDSWMIAGGSILLMFVCLGGYYAMSAQFLRRAQTWPLLAASAAGVSSLVALSTIVDQDSMDGLVTVVAFAVSAMTYTLLVVSFLVNSRSQKVAVSTDMVRAILPVTALWCVALILG